MTGILSLLRLLLEAATLWLRLQVLAFPEKAQKEADEIEDEIQRLRDTGKPLDALRADRLRERLARKVGLARSISAAVNPPSSGADSPNDGRPLHPPS